MLKYMSTSITSTVKRTTLEFTDQPVFMKMEPATHQEPTMDAEKFKHGNGLTPTTN